MGKGLIKGTIEAYGVLYLLNENTLKEHSNEFNSLFYVVMAGCLWQIARELAKQYDEHEEKKEIVKWLAAGFIIIIIIFRLTTVVSFYFL